MEDTSFQLFYKIVRQILKNVGLDIPHRGWKVFNPFLAVNYFLMTIQLYISSVFIINHIDSLALVTECASTTATGIQVFVKCSMMFYYRHAWAETLEVIDEHRAELIGRYDKILRFHTNRAALWVKSLYYLYLVVSVGFVVIAIVHPEPTKLPLSFNFPHLPWTENPYWTINFIHHIYVCFIAAHFTSGMDAITLLMILHSYCRIDIMIEMLNELQSLINRKILKHDLETEINLKLKILYTEHYKTLDFVKKCQNYFSLILFVQVVTDTMIICMSLNVIATTLVNGCYIFLLAGAFQHFVSCYFGDILIERNDAFIAKLYSIDWYKMNVKQQKSLSLILQSAQRPCKIDALFFQINLESFLVVIKSSYSYFALLQKMGN